MILLLVLSSLQFIRPYATLSLLSIFGGTENNAIVINNLQRLAITVNVPILNITLNMCFHMKIAYRYFPSHAQVHVRHVTLATADMISYFQWMC